ncbi:MAG: HEAT repeat domain-containing protein [Alphaproteobacteria bacterium]|nr:HEAT repeat domain-containing protein [Alphaproteobacteria bacterium]MCB9791972.1 HEAT repeat domain-containing protein [Alphaproteobacteria bacterium]
MDPAVDPFLPLLKLLDRYRRDVHRLNPGASEAAIRAAERHLGHRLPLTLGGFLRRYNGGSLFRGALRLRSTTELAPPDDALPSLVAFADVPGGRQWVYGQDGAGDQVFGELVDGELRPLHARFDRWLNGTLRVFDEDLHDAEKELQARLDVDPEGGYLLLTDGEEALASGDPERAMRRFAKATAVDPALIRAWQRLGEMHLSQGDRSQARFALLRALRASRLPAPYPGFPVLSRDALGTLTRLFPPGDAGWQRELETFLEERVTDVRSELGVELFEAAALSVGRCLLALGGRRQARDVLLAQAERARAFARKGTLSGLTLELVRLETDLGEHDAAEAHLRGLLRAPDAETRGRAHLALAAIVVARQEPWAEEILDEARDGLRRAADLAQYALLRADRLLLHDRREEATELLRAADQHAIRAGDLSAQGRVCIGLGDVARIGRDLPAAAELYEAAEARAREAGDAELLRRVEVRRGALAMASGDRTRACALYFDAARGYEKLQLPVREAWALLRFARAAEPGAERDSALRRARELFTAPGVQLAAGVGALDVISGEPERSLAWHLECSAAHARDRLNAQRGRPPLTRADADRPERRLGAHRVAVGAANAKVVEAISVELASLSGQLAAAQARGSDPKVTAYIAATDLLSYHRSYEAGQVLLRQLFERQLPDRVARALKASITRSPNASLVDGLLSAVESPGEPGATANAAEVLGWRRELSAAPALTRLTAESNPLRVRRAAIVALGRIGHREAIEPLLDALETSALAEDAAVALLLLGDRRGVDFHGQALASGMELDNPPGEIVGRYGGPSYLLLLMAAAGETGPKAIAALQGLGYLGDPRALPKLLGGLGARDRAQVAVACGALELLTGHREDPDLPGVHARWERWWEERASDFTEGVRYRYGRPLDPLLLTEKLGDDDRLVRRGAYDELVITTGNTLPFDADGPYRVQLAHRRAWWAWCQKNADRFPAGGWTFHGREIG